MHFVSNFVRSENIKSNIISKCNKLKSNSFPIIFRTDVLHLMTNFELIFENQFFVTNKVPIDVTRKVTV